jgi:hypothetical protein
MRARRLLVAAFVGLAGAGRIPVGAAQSIRPAEFPSEHRRADSLLRAGRFEAARDVFARLTRADGENQAYWLGLGESEAGAGRPAEAIAALRQALALGGGSRPDRSYQIARLYAALGERDSVVAWLDRALAARYERRPSIANDSSFQRFSSDSGFRRVTGAADSSGSRDEGWRRDLAFLVSEAKRLAVGPDPVALTPAFDSAAALLSDRIPSLEDDQVFVELQRLVASLGQGHSLLYPVPTKLVQLRMLPVDLYFFSDGLYVIAGSGEAASLVGSRVERIGGVDPEDAIRRIAPIVTHENPMGLRWVGPYFLGYPAILQAVGLEAQHDTVHLELRDRSGRARRVALVAGDFRPPGKLIAPPGKVATGRVPLYLRHPDEPYWMERLPASAALYLQFNQVVNREGLSLAEFADSALRVARRPTVRNLIVDVRRNNGGSGDLNRALIRALVAFELLEPRRTVYLITGRNTFSAAQNFINDAERLTDAVFVGEPSSSRPNFAGEDTELLLPYSGIQGSLSSRYFQDSSPLDDRVWIAPDIPVRLASHDYFANRDPVLEAVFDAIRLANRPGLARARAP